MNQLSSDLVTIPNPKPKFEVIGLLFTFLLCAGVATWWAIQIPGPLTQTTITIGSSLTLLWVMTGFIFLRHSTTKQGTLKVNPADKSFILNNVSHKFEDLNFYRSILVAPTIGIAAGYSIQTIEIGVGQTRYKISDDIAVKLFNDEQYNALKLLNQTNGLTAEQNESFSNWLERVQQSREHASPNPESNKS